MCPLQAILSTIASSNRLARQRSKPEASGILQSSGIIQGDTEGSVNFRYKLIVYLKQPYRPRLSNSLHDCWNFTREHCTPCIIDIVFYLNSREGGWLRSVSAHWALLVLSARHSLVLWICLLRTNKVMMTIDDDCVASVYPRPSPISDIHVPAWLSISCNPQYGGQDCWEARDVVVWNSRSKPMANTWHLLPNCLLVSQLIYTWWLSLI